MSITFATNRPLNRRAFLRGAGICLGLPFLDAMLPAFGRASQAAAADAPRRMVAIQIYYGILPQYFFPEQAGADYEPSPYLQILKKHLKDLTVFSGVSHPSVDGGHAAADACFLTAAPHAGSSVFKNSISLDQIVAERLGDLTQYPFLTAGTGPSLSYTRAGVGIPVESSPAKLYRRLFVQGSPEEVKKRIEELRNGRSILDFVQGSVKRLQRDVGPKDQDRLDQYFTSVRSLETQLQKNAEWTKRPKPKVNEPMPPDVPRAQIWTWCRCMYDIIRLALEADSTRLVTLSISSGGTPADIAGVTHDTHSLTHHGFRADAIAELQRIENAMFHALNQFLSGLRATAENGVTLLDRTMVLFGSCLGNANSHTNVNLPILLAGGGFRHGQHLAFDRNRNYPLPNLFLSMLQRLGLEIDRFASSTGTMRGLEMA